MVSQRSPRCPQIMFVEAALRARAIYAKRHTDAADKNTILKDLGYTSANGSSLKTIGALRQYGLLEAVGKDLKISDAAVDFFELREGSLEKKRAMLKLAFRPALFKELLNDY